MISRGADINCRTSGGNGPSPLNLAINELGHQHPIALVLKKFGAEDVTGEDYDGNDENHEEEKEIFDDEDGDEDGVGELHEEIGEDEEKGFDEELDEMEYTSGMEL